MVPSAEDSAGHKTTAGEYMTDDDLRRILLRLNLDRMPQSKEAYYEALKRVVAEAKRQEQWKPATKIGALLGD